MEIASMKKIAEAIAAKISVEKIYNSTYGDIQSCHLIILLPPDNGTKFTELEPFVKMVTIEHENITFELHHTTEVVNALKSGNLFFNISCSEENLLFNKENSPKLPVPKAQELLLWKDEAIERFKEGISKTTAFLDGAYFYQKKNNYNLTVFMLHQVAELTFRALELSVLAKERRTHNLSKHQQFLCPAIPKIANIFPADSKQDIQILETLNNAYSSVRYEQNYTVNEKYIPVLFDRVIKLQAISREIMEELSAVLDAKSEEILASKNFIPDDQMIFKEVILSKECNQPVNTDQQLPEIKEIINLAIEYLSAEQVYLIGDIKSKAERTNLFKPERNGIENHLHFDILVLSSIQNPYSNNIQSILNKKYNEKVTLNLFIHSKEEVEKRIINKNRFFETVLSGGILIHSKSEIKYDLDDLNLNSDRFLVNIHKYSVERIHRANALLKAANDVKDEVCEVTISLLAQSMEQACLGLIYAFMGYHPNLHSLHHLLNICKIFWPDGEIYFPREMEYDKYLLNIISKSHSDLRFAVKTTEPDDLTDIFSRCSNFIEMAECFCLQEVEALTRERIITKTL